MDHFTGRPPYFLQKPGNTPYYPPSKVFRMTRGFPSLKNGVFHLVFRFPAKCFFQFSTDFLSGGVVAPSREGRHEGDTFL